MLYDRDAVQTGPDGAAAIEYGPKVTVQVEEERLGRRHRPATWAGIPSNRRGG